MTLKKILCIGALMALPMSMSAGNNHKQSVAKVFENAVEKLKNYIIEDKKTYSCRYNYYLENEKLYDFTKEKPMDLVAIEKQVIKQFGHQEIGTFALLNTHNGVLVKFVYFSNCNKITSDHHRHSKTLFTSLMKEKDISVNFNQAKQIKSEMYTGIYSIDFF